MIHKVVHYIDAPFDWIGVDDYSSHRNLLWLALNNTKGNVVELGCGEGSTMLLYKECKRTKRHFSSYETLLPYVEKIGNNIVTKINNYEELLLHQPSLLFIDSAPGEQRKDLVELHKDNADVIILHDTEPGAISIYGIGEVLNSFKHRLDYYPEGNPGTTVLSNKIDVTKWIIP